MNFIVSGLLRVLPLASVIVQDDHICEVLGALFVQGEHTCDVRERLAHELRDFASRTSCPRSSRYLLGTFDALFF